MATKSVSEARGALLTQIYTSLLLPLRPTQANALRGRVLGYTCWGQTFSWNPEARDKYIEILQFFCLPEDGNVLCKTADDTLKLARGSLCCGELLSCLLEEEDKAERRKGCKEQLKVAEKQGLHVPTTLKDRAKQAVLMSLKS